jgi:glutamate formiminotransferase
MKMIQGSINAASNREIVRLAADSRIVFSCKQGFIQSAVNFSEGRRPAVIDRIAHAADEITEVVAADASADPDHNRMVVTFLGAPEGVRHAILAAAAIAIEAIDMRRHRGVHPRIGAIDVIPFTPVGAMTMERCTALAEDLGKEMARRFELPIYFYAQNTHTGRPSSLPELRRGGFESLHTAMRDGKLVPDVGPSSPHPTAGAAIIGAREPLVAWNILLKEPDISVARSIASRIRHDRENNPALAGVRALGLYLETTNTAQISMNLTQTERTGMPGVFDYVQSQCEKMGCHVKESEVIGLISRKALCGKSPEAILWTGYREEQILEYWMK